MKYDLIAVGDRTVSSIVRSFEAARLFQQELPNVHIYPLPDHGNVPIYEADIVLYSRPMSTEIVRSYQNSGSLVIADQDDSFEDIPRHHVAYGGIGPGNSSALDEHRRCLAMADALVVSTPALAQRLCKYNQNIVVIPNAWSSLNPLWLENFMARGLRSDNIFTVGWGGTMTHRNDWKRVVEQVVEFIRSHQDTRLLIVGDPDIYKMFSSIPERQRVFWNMLPYELYPYFFRNINALMAPLDDDIFNRYKSDIKLVEAGISGVPWVASRVEPYLLWSDGGILISAVPEWGNALEHLYTSRALCEHLALDGHAKALTRSSQNMLPLWKQAIEQARNEHSNGVRRPGGGMELLRVENGSPIQGNKRKRHRR